ncbi:DUF1993 domain-containing protein [bacterium]|nr:DUF1993 domain-containing protein [bacterium]
MNKKFVEQYIKMLNNLDGLLVKAAAHADANKFDVNNFVTDRLAVDMLPFARQIQIACDTAKLAVASFSFSEAPKFEDNEKTIAELRERIKKTLDFLKSKVEADFSKFKDAKYAPFWANGMWLDGESYFYEHAMPNFYFHVQTAYAILRTRGVNVGKADYIGALNFQK